MVEQQELALAAMRAIYFDSIQRTEDAALAADNEARSIYEAALARNKDLYADCERKARQTLKEARLPADNPFARASQLALANYTARAELASKVMQQAGEEANRIHDEEVVAATREYKIEALIAQEIAEVLGHGLDEEKCEFERINNEWDVAEKKARAKRDAALARAKAKCRETLTAANKAYQEAIGPAKASYDARVEALNQAEKAHSSQAEAACEAALAESESWRRQADETALSEYDNKLKAIAERRHEERRLRVEAWFKYLADFKMFCSAIA